MITHAMNREEMLKILKGRGQQVEKFLTDLFQENTTTPQRLKDAMLYSLNAGGKRLRPALCLTCASLFGLDTSKALPFAAAIEMIHTYSLIHDDLPAMDNDDLRRGKPSNHKAFDEATAILAGDGLLTDAFWLISTMRLPANYTLAALNRLAEAAGSSGMDGGQMLDMLYTGKPDITIEQVAQMQSMKTGAIIEASCACGAILAGAKTLDIKDISSYGKYLGRAFQIVDDILDVTGNEKELGKPVGSDEQMGKNTYPSLIGLEKSKELAVAEAENAKKALARFSGSDAEFLRCLADYTISRAA